MYRLPWLFCAALLISFTAYKQSEKASSQTIPDSEDQLAARILSALNKDVEPCSDFYEFACGGWIKNNPKLYWNTHWNQFTKVTYQVSTDLRDILIAPDDAELPDAVRKAKSLYRTCMDTESLEAVDLKPIHKVLKTMDLPTHPPSEPTANFTWVTAAGKSRRMLGLSVLLDVQIIIDGTNTSRHRVVVTQAPPTSEFELRYLLQPQQFAHELAQYQEYIKSMITTADPEADAVGFAADILAFSKSLARITEVHDDDNYDASVSVLNQGFNGVPLQWNDHDWSKYMELVFAETNVTLDQNTDQLYVVGLSYLKKLSVLLSDTKPLVVERFLWWRIFSTVAPMTWISEQQLTKPRWKICAELFKLHFDSAQTYMYVKRHFDENSREKAIEMSKDIQEAFASTLQELDWMDPKTRHNALNKLRAMHILVGYPTWVLNREQLDKHYKDAEVVEGNLFETYLKLTWANVRASLQLLREKHERNRWHVSATTVRATYTKTLNSVTIPAGILQPPFYGNGLEAINYGSLGAVIGHEVTHGFDPKGKLFDEEGNRKDWWSAATLEHYQEKVQCIIDQYSKYHMDGVKTQNENIADNGGLRAAFNAYSRFTKRHPTSRRLTLPALPEYSPEQLFFLGFAQTWCGNSTEDDQYSSNKIRVIGTLSNSKEFADAWECPAGSPMNPEHKCVIW